MVYCRNSDEQIASFTTGLLALHELLLSTIPVCLLPGSNLNFYSTENSGEPPPI